MVLAKLMIISGLNFLDWFFEMQQIVFILEQGDRCGYKTQMYTILGV